MGLAAGIKDRDAQNVVATLVRERELLQEQLREREDELRLQQAQLEARHRQVTRHAAGALQYTQDPVLQQWLQAQEKAVDTAPDPEVAKHALGIVRGLVQQLQGAGQRMEEARRAEEAAYQAEQVRVANRDYIASHIDDFRDPQVVERVKVLHQTHGMSVQDAHRISLAERVAAQAKDVAELKAQAQEASRQRIARSRPAPEETAPPAGLDAVGRDRWYQEHPEAARARLQVVRNVGYRGKG